jgi:hypothetical protein
LNVLVLFLVVLVLSVDQRAKPWSVTVFLAGSSLLHAVVKGKPQQMRDQHCVQMLGGGGGSQRLYA